jgi:hypothetical protein
MPGGVCAVLDYEVDAMAEYVAEMATRVVTPEATVSAPFRKFVSQILTSTRLPSTTILLGMNYLAKRINMSKAQGPFKASEGQTWRLMTVALLLGSKFLDDNTFQNRSWSEVSGIAVSELNTLEYEWLDICKWQLYVNLDHSKDYRAWLENWEEWRENKKRQAADTRNQRLAALPILETGFSRMQPMASPPPYARTAGVSQMDVARYNAKKNEMVQRQAYRHQEGVWGQNQFRPQAPITPPDSGYSTPEYIMSATSTNAQYNDWFAHALRYNGGYQQPQPQSAFYSRHGNYPGHYAYGGWETGVAECSCATCLGPAAKQPYFVSHGFGQPVMG